MATTAPRFRYLGTTDDTTTCERCGREELRSTVVLVMLDADGNPDGDALYYGSTCAARALGLRSSGASVLASARAAVDGTRGRAEAARQRLAHYALPEAGEPTRDQLRHAVRVYNRTNRNVADICQRENTTVTALVLDMLRRDRADIAALAALRPGR